MLKNPIFPVIGMALLIPLRAWAQAPNPGQAAPQAAQAKAAPEPPAEPPTEAEKIVDAAIKKLTSLKSVSADLVQKVDMLSQQFRIEGRYLKAPERRVYLRLTVKGLEDSAGTTLQVCDGKTLWDYQQILENQIYHKLDVVKVFEKLESPDLDPRLREQIVNQMGFAGPETLLAGLRKVVRFEQKEDGTLDGRPVWKVHGTWRNRDGLLGGNLQQLPPTASLPPYVPSVVTVWIGKDDGWPYKVLLLGKATTILEDTRPIGPDGKRIGAKSSVQKIQPSRVELSYSNVKLNPALKIEEFVFQAPPDAQIEDNTEGIVSTLDQAIRVEASKKKGSDSGETLLNQPIEVKTTPAK